MRSQLSQSDLQLTFAVALYVTLAGLVATTIHCFFTARDYFVRRLRGVWDGSSAAPTQEGSGQPSSDGTSPPDGTPPSSSAQALVLQATAITVMGHAGDGDLSSAWHDGARRRR
jgi:hypothetical protein